MADVFRLFYGDAPIVHSEFSGEPSKEILAVVHRAELRDGLWKDTFSGGGKTLSFSSAPQGRTEVEKKRLRKRQGQARPVRAASGNYRNASGLGFPDRHPPFPVAL